MPRRFTEEDQQRIKQAVSEAERRTSGEIVPYVVGSSDDYEVAIWRGAGFSALAALLVAFLIFQFYHGWGLGWLHTGWGTGLFVLAAGTLGTMVTALIPPVKRLLAGANLLTARTHARAMRAFLEEEVFNTCDRTGILIFISLFEHRIEVLGDAGINARVTPDDWAEIVEHIRSGLKRGNISDALVVAIEDCGKLLEEKGLATKSDDTDELANALRLREK